MSKTFCKACGNELHPDAEVCPKCGVRQQGSTGKKSKVTAGLLALFLGGIGIHHFYLGKVGNIIAGVLYLLFCWTFIPAMIAFVEAIIYFAIPEKSFDEVYNSK